MEGLIIYLLKVNVVISILFFTYFVFFRHEKFFRLNRFILLGTLVISLVLPLAPASNSLVVNDWQNRVRGINPLTRLYTSIGTPDKSSGLSGKVDLAPQNTPGFISSLTFKEIVLGLYLLIALILFVRFILQLRNVLLLIRKNKKNVSGGVTYCHHDRKFAPFSFFHYLAINESKHSAEQLEQIIAHEKIHIRGWHSIDILFAEIAHIFLWMNPLALKLKEQIKLNLEYIADEKVLKNGIDKKNYQLNILQGCLNTRTYPLTNLFNSSKIKLRIKMMNSKKSPASHLYKYAFVLPLILATYFLVNPLKRSQAQLAKKELQPTPKELKGLEGYYQSQNDKNSFLQITANGNGLVLKQLWDGKEIAFEQKSELEFFCKEQSFPLKFNKDKDGTISQVLAFEKDLWDRVKDYNPLTNMPIQVSPQLSAFEGYYQAESNKEAYLQFFVKGTDLVAKELWTGREYVLAPTSDLEFSSKTENYPARFTKDKNGAITQVLVFNKDVWIKIKDYKPVIKKEVKLSAEQLKAVEGKYQFQFEKGVNSFLQIKAMENHIILKQLWDGEEIKFVAQSELDFFCKEAPFPLQFKKDKSGVVTQMLAFNKDLWTKVKE